MCMRYIAPEVGDIERQWQVGNSHTGPSPRLIPMLLQALADIKAQPVPAWCI